MGDAYCQLLHVLLVETMMARQYTDVNAGSDVAGGRDPGRPGPPGGRPAGRRNSKVATDRGWNCRTGGREKEAGYDEQA